VRKAKASTLRHEFDSLKFRDGELVDEFGTRITQLTNRLAVLGDDYTEEEIVRKFLQALPPRFDQIVASIETLLDLVDVTVDELIGRLKAAEERLGRSGDDSPIAKLNLTEDELVARLSSPLKMTGNGGSERGKESFSRGKRGRDRGRGRGKGSGGRDRGRDHTVGGDRHDLHQPLVRGVAGGDASQVDICDSTRQR
jgi:hypothetical protein